MRARFILALLLFLTNPVDAADTPSTWAFNPPIDAFSAGALLDLRSMNEKVAGQSGFVTRTPDGSDFALGSGAPVRFWAVDEYVQQLDGMEAVAHKARWLAKRGVNMVRVHSVLAPSEPGSRAADVNQKEVDRIWKLVAAMKREGIYTTISPYWSIPVKVQESWHVPGGAQPATALLFWDPTLQAAYRSWLRALYSRPNPYTGIPLASDPAVAIIQIQNEDSLLFWTLQGIKGAQLRELRGIYGSWLVRQYGSLEAANAAWGGEHPGDAEFQDHQGDDFKNTRAGIYIIWHLTQPRSGYMGRRLADQLHFLADAMLKFNRDTETFLRRELGCKQLINAGNWRPADPVRLFDAERYSYTANEVMAVNRYFTGEHIGPDNGWAIRVGDRFTNNSVLLDPRGMPTNVKQPVGYPFIIPETGWVPPTAYQSEGSLLTAAYQSLTGVDISYFFADGDVPEWQQPFGKPVGGWQPPTGKWSIATPMQLGQFPAAAVLFRRSYVHKARPAVHEERSLEDLWERRSPLIAEEGGYDPNRDSGELPARSAVKTGVDPLAFLVGPVEVKLGGDPAKSRTADLNRYIDRKQKVVKALNGEVRLNYGRGIAVVNAACAQGACGFLNRVPEIGLNDFTIRCQNDYASITAVSLDGAPIGATHKLLIQVGTTARPAGWRDGEATWSGGEGKGPIHGRVVLSVGANPWSIVSTDAVVIVRNSNLRTARALDANFMPVRNLSLQRTGGKVELRLPPDALYTVLE